MKKHLITQAGSALLLLACTAPTGLSQESDGSSRPGSETPVLRFGDPEGHLYDRPFFPGTEYDPAITTPDSILGQLHGSRLSHHAEVLACFRAWADESPRITLATHGRTHEGRELVHAVITSEANHARLAEIRADLAKLADPRGVAEGELERIVAGSPACAWMGYSIHGDELSGTDGGVALGYHLVAGRGEAVESLLERVVVVLDPCLNPDGRERIIGMVEQSAGYTPNLDYASMHRGRWPWGRGNHYLFDMNRDWMAGTQPETRARWAAALAWHPQLFVDAHEMGSLDTFLFYPQADPINPHFAEHHVAWQRAYAEGAAKAFDAYGWSYYTREWADGWAPFYSDAWGSLAGATGILYEQAGTAGFALRRASGRIQTYREAVHHQAVASLANLSTLVERRRDALAAYLENKRRNVAADTPGNDQTFVVERAAGVPGTRVRELLRTLLGQEIEVFEATAPFEARNAEGLLGQREATHAFPAGSLLVHARQPLGQMVKAYLEFDPRLDDESLRKEREDLERKDETRIYDLTAWSLPHALGLDAWWVDALEPEARRLTELPPVETRLATAAGTGVQAPVAWVVDGLDDAAPHFAARAMERSLRLHACDEPFEIGQRSFARGSLVVRLHENEGSAELVGSRVLEAAREASVAEVVPVTTGLAPGEGPDLGGQHFHLLERPRIALLSNSPVSPDTYGHLWHHLDRVLGVPFTILDAQALGGADLRRYNVLVLPPGGVSEVLEPMKDELETWVRNGGTLVACGGSAAALTRERLGLSSVVLRRNALDDLGPYRRAAEREWAARDVQVDPAEVWGNGTVEPEEAQDEEDEKGQEVTEEDDEWLRRFSPYGVTLRGVVRDDHWITAGTPDEVPLYFSGSNVFLSRDPVVTPVRLAEADRLRLGGLVWPEARGRIAESAWLTVERKGNGQVILFAAMPAFRGYQDATGRLFSNAVVYGPGLGASQPLGW